MGWFGAGHINTPQFDTQTSTASKILYVRFQKTHLFAEVGELCGSRNGYIFWSQKWNHPCMCQKEGPRNGYRICPHFWNQKTQSLDAEPRWNLGLKSKLANHVHKDCFYQAHMSCNTAPCLEVLQGFSPPHVSLPKQSLNKHL